MRSQHRFPMIKVRARAIVSATVRTVIVAFADIGIGKDLCLFCLLGVYANSPYIKKKTEIKSPSFLLVDYFQIFSNYFSKYTRKNAAKCPLVVRGFYTEPITKYAVNNNKVFTFIEKREKRLDLQGVFLFYDIEIDCG